MSNIRYFFIIVLVPLAIALHIGCYKSNVQTFSIAVPTMSDQNSAKTVSSALKDLGGIVNFQLDLEKRNVIVSYDSLVTAQKNIEAAIAKSGYDANSIKSEHLSKAEPVKRIYKKEQ